MYMPEETELCRKCKTAPVSLTPGIKPSKRESPSQPLAKIDTLMPEIYY